MWLNPFQTTVCLQLFLESLRYLEMLTEWELFHFFSLVKQSPTVLSNQLMLFHIKYLPNICFVQLHLRDFSSLSHTAVIGCSGLVVSQVGFAIIVHYYVPTDHWKWHLNVQTKSVTQNIHLSILLRQWKRPWTCWIIQDMYGQPVALTHTC